MMGLAMSQVMVSAPSAARRAPFLGGLTDHFGRGSRLGQDAGQSEYNRAIRQIQRYDSLVLRAQKIANATVRQNILAKYYGPLSDTEGIHWEAEKVRGYVNDAQKYTPVNTIVFTQQRVMNATDRLSGDNDDFEGDVQSAEATYGVLPAPVIERVVETQITQQTPGWVYPVVGVGAAAVLVAAGMALGVIKL